MVDFWGFLILFECQSKPEAAYVTSDDPRFSFCLKDN